MITIFITISPATELTAVCLLIIELIEMVGMFIIYGHTLIGGGMFTPHVENALPIEFQ